MTYVVRRGLYYLHTADGIVFSWIVQKAGAYTFESRAAAKEFLRHHSPIRPIKEYDFERAD